MTDEIQYDGIDAYDGWDSIWRNRFKNSANDWNNVV